MSLDPRSLESGAKVTVLKGGGNTYEPVRAIRARFANHTSHSGNCVFLTDGKGNIFTCGYDEEGVRWLRGWVPRDSAAVRALKTADALVNPPSSFTFAR